MGRHLKVDKPSKPNDILDIGAVPSPEGGIELAVVVRLEDTAFKVSKIFSVEEFDYIMGGLDLCMRTAEYKARPVPKREVPTVAPSPFLPPPPPPPSSPDPEKPS